MMHKQTTMGETICIPQIGVGGGGDGWGERNNESKNDMKSVLCTYAGICGPLDLLSILNSNIRTN